MRKIIVFSSAILMLLIVNLSANAIEVKASDYEVVNDSSEVSEAQATKVIPLNEEKTEFKFNYGEKLGYYNKETNVKFAGDFDNIVLFDKYLKVKKSKKYGIVNKEGKLIIPVSASKIEIVKNNDSDYFAAKIDGEYQLYNDVGELVPENELSLIPNTFVYFLADAIRPEFIESYIEAYSEKPEEKIVQTTQTELEEIEVPETSQTAHIEKNMREKEVLVNEKLNSGESKFFVKDKEYTLTYINNKFGVKNENKEEILAVEFDSISLKNPSNNLSEPVLIALKDDANYVYSLKGKLLADNTDGEIKVYNGNNTYSVKFDGDEGILKKNGTDKGLITLSNGTYTYKPFGFTLFKPVKINEMIMTVLSISK